jgi:hypothetical protein
MQKTAWTKQERAELKRLVKTGNYTYPEIAKIIGKPKWHCQLVAQRMGLRNLCYLSRITKHTHLRKPIMEYFLSHSWEETRRHFGLTDSELKSVFTVGYRDPKLRSLRKDKRRKDEWSLEEIRYLLQTAGIQPRDWISRRLNRGGVHAVKESLSRLGISSKHLNGMPIKWAEIIFRNIKLPTAIKTKAGPPGGSGNNFTFRIIPWVVCEKVALNNRNIISADIVSLIRSMARFQRWVFGTDSTSQIIRRINEILKEAS